MTLALDLRVYELLCSRLLHDLSNPVGAVNNGLELVTELGGELDGEVVEMVAGSARTAAARLRFFRAAFGLPGGAAPEPAEAAAATAGYAGSHERGLEWRVAEAGLPPHAVRLLLAMAMLAVDALPRGGAVRIAAAPGTDLVAEAAGPGAGLREEVVDALDPDVPVEALSARSAHAFYAAALARDAGGRIEAEGRVDSLVLRVRLPG